MEESSEFKMINNNINRDGNQECIKYDREELIRIASKCRQDNRYRDIKQGDL